MRVALALAAVALAALVAGPAAASVDLDGLEADLEPGLEEAQAINFVSTCRFSHRAPDDPIVYPKQPGASHDHTFIGNTSTNAFSTYKSLRSSSTTCHRPDDTAAYWTPTLFVGGEPVVPRRVQVYYRRATYDDVRAFPAGFRVIAGETHAMSPQPQRVTRWHCGADSGVRPSAWVPTCPDVKGNALRLRVTFPSCWDGWRLDSPDHQSHVAYAQKGYCPSTHPVAVPAITLALTYATTGGPTAELASGGQLSAHADFANAWRQAELARLVDVCLNAARRCARGD